jgi:YidC/Oxa1 family membrane protein insertase
MEMDKRTLIAVVLALVVLIGSQYFLPHTPPQQPAPTPQTSEPPAGPAKKAPLPTAVSPVAEEPSRAAKEVTVDTGVYVATLTSKGGTIKRFDLKTYKEKEVPVSLLKPQEMFSALGLGTKDDFDLSKADFTVRGTDVSLKNAETGVIIFEYATPQLSIRRTYTFYGNRYKFDLKDEVNGVPEYWITLGSDFGIFDTKDSSAQHIGPVVLKDTDRIEMDAKSLAEPKVYRDGLRWIAQEDKYFFASIVPSGQVVEAKAWKVQDTPLLALKMKSGENNFLVYAGPKDYDSLQTLKVGLEHIIDFGFFSILSRPLFWILKFFYNFLGNYGWAIVLLTIVVRVPFIPLLNKSQKSMRKMQEIQPKIAELREKYKKDPQKLQKETMEMYKKHKVNPVGGCLPMLLQIPVFFALYKVLMVAIELRGAPFMLWLTDLSGPDTLFGHIPAWFPLLGGFAVGPLPLAMGITMVIQQKMTPTSLDPKQNKMMMMMPVVFTFMFLNFASGLVLYWLVNNVLSIIQQFFTNRRMARESA